MGLLSSKLYWFPLSIQSGMTAAVFVYAGCLVGKFNIINNLKKSSILIVLFLWLIAIWKAGGLSLAMNHYGHGYVFLLNMIGALSGTCCVIVFSRMLDRWSGPFVMMISKFGTSSLAILCVHLVEDDVTPWDLLLPKLLAAITCSTSNGYLLVFGVFILRIIFDAILAYLIYRLPKINVVFYPVLLRQ